MSEWRHDFCEHITRFIVQYQEYFEYVFKSQKVKRNQLLYLMDDPARELYIVRSGSVRLTVISEDGREEILSIRKPGEHFGALCLCPEYYWDHQATVHEDGVVIMMKSHDFYRVFYGHDEVLRAFLSFFSGELDKMQRTIQKLQKTATRKRVLYFLNKQILDGFQDRPLPEECKLVMSPLFTKIAESTRLSEGEVESILNRLKEEKILDWKRNSLTINTRAVEKALEEAIIPPDTEHTDETAETEAVTATA